MILDLERKLAAAENKLNGAVQGKLDSLKRAGAHLVIHIDTYIHAYIYVLL